MRAYRIQLTRGNAECTVQYNSIRRHIFVFFIFSSATSLPPSLPRCKLLCAFIRCLHMYDNTLPVKK